MVDSDRGTLARGGTDRWHRCCSPTRSRCSTRRWRRCSRATRTIRWWAAAARPTRPSRRSAACTLTWCWSTPASACRARRAWSAGSSRPTRAARCWCSATRAMSTCCWPRSAPVPQGWSARPAAPPPCCGWRGRCWPARGRSRGRCCWSWPGASRPRMGRAIRRCPACRGGSVRCWGCSAAAGTTPASAASCSSASTVRTHIQNILEKLGMHSKLEAATFAMQRPFELDPGPNGTGPD
jgi:hypothetical protein